MLPLVMLHWIDSETGDGWEDLADSSSWRPPTIRSVGWMLHEATDEAPWYVLLGDCSLPDDAQQSSNRRIVIPRGMVSKVVTLPI